MPIVGFTYETPKVVASELLIELLFILWLLKGTTRPFLQTITKPRLLLGIFLLTVVHLIFFRTETTFFGNTFRMQGVFLMWHLLVLTCISATWKDTYMHIPSVFFVLLCLLVTGILLGGDETGRAFGLLGQPNSLAATAIFLWPFFLKFTSRKQWVKKMMVGSTFVVTLAILFITGSRSGLLAFLLQLYFLVSLVITKKSFSKAVMTSFLIIGISLFLPLFENLGVLENRAEIWQTAWIAGWKSPLVGNGFGNIEQALQSASLQVSNNVRFQLVDSAHNLFLDWWVQGGVIGVGLLVALLFSAFSNLVTQKKTIELTVLLGLLVAMQFNPVSVVILVGFWWLLGQGFVSDRV